MPSNEQILVDIRARINYESFYRDFFGEGLRRRGRELSARCPFHDDNDPSWSANAETGLWICRVPSCPGHAGGDFIAFLRLMSNVNFTEAVRRAADHVGISIAESATARYTRIARENAAVDEDALLARHADALRVLERPAPFIDGAIVDAFHDSLRTGTVDRLDWLFHNRGITYDTVRRYKIGHTGDRYTIPIDDGEGYWVNIRQYKADAVYSQKMISWREGFGSARLFPLNVLRDDHHSPVFIMEGEWDCLLARQLGLNAVTSTGGAGTWPDSFSEEFGGDDVVICYDNDDAGRAGALNVATSLTRSLTPSTVRIFDWRHIPDGPSAPGMPDGYDFTDYIVRDHGTKESFLDNCRYLAPFELTSPPVVPPPPQSVTEVIQEIDDRLNRTDVGNARRLARRHGGDVRYVSRNWYVWDGTRYALDETGEIDRRAKETARSIFEETAACTDDDARGKLAAFSLASESVARIRAMVDLARSERPIAVSSAEMDTNPYLLNCTNGTYDFQLHDMRDHRREDLITMSTGQPYDESEVCPGWDEFVLRTFDGNQDVIEFVQRAIGYSLIGVTTEQVLFFCYGTGANGKSTFLETIRDVVGDYARTADFSTFATARGGHTGPRNDIMRLRNARFVTAIEFDAGRALDEIVIKQLTGGDTISARRLYAESEEFRPTFTPWIAGNHKPIVKGTDEAIWRRLRLLPFTITIPHGERDPHLRQRLFGEAPGILRWAIRGAESWMTMGLRPPEEVLIATQSYRSEMDTVEPFLESCTIRETSAQIKTSQLYSEYKRWAEESGEEPISKTAFGLRLGEKGYVSRNRGGVHYRVGIRLRNGDDLLDAVASTNGTNNGSRVEQLHGSVHNAERDIHAIVHDREEPFEPRPPGW